MIYVLLGRRELGKSTLALYLTRDVQTIVLDPRGLMPAAHGDHVVHDLVTDPGVIDDLLDADVRRIVVRPDDHLDATTQALARIVRDQCSFRRDRSLGVILDEAGILDLTTWDWPVRCGPRDRLRIVITGHRPQDVPTSIRALTDRWCLFRITQEHDLKPIDERCGPTVAASVRRLSAREWILWDDARGEMRRFADARLWYVPGISQSSAVDPGAGLSAGDGDPMHDRPLLRDDV